MTWLGHSLGGQVLLFARHDLVARVLLVAAGSGYWRHNVGTVRLVAPLLWRVIVPLSTRLAGYYPGRRLRMVGDLPTGVVRQWGRWCLSEDYLAVDVPDAAARYAEVTVPISTLHFTDDELLSEASMQALEALYTGPPSRRSDSRPPTSAYPGSGTTASSAARSATRGSSTCCRGSPRAEGGIGVVLLWRPLTFSGGIPAEERPTSPVNRGS